MFSHLNHKLKTKENRNNICSNNIKITVFWKRVQKEKPCGKLWSHLFLINIHDENGQFILIKIHAACSTCHPRGSAFQFPWHIILLEVSGDVRLTIIWKRDCPTLSAVYQQKRVGGLSSWTRNLTHLDSDLPKWKLRSTEAKAPKVFQVFFPGATFMYLMQECSDTLAGSWHTSTVHLPSLQIKVLSWQHFPGYLAISHSHSFLIKKKALITHILYTTRGENI